MSPPSSSNLPNLLRRLLHDRLARTSRALNHYRQHPTPSSLHDLRTDLRKARLHLILAAKQLPPRKSRATAEALRELNRHLGPLRDLDVVALTLKRLSIKHPPVSALLPTLKPRLARDRVNARRSVKSFLTSTGSHTLENILTHSPRPLPAPLLPLHASWTAEQIRKAIRRIRRARQTSTSTHSETLHDLRIRMRRTRLILDMAQPPPTPRQKKLIPRIRAAEKTLGKLHDLDMTLAWLAAGSEPGRAPLKQRLNRQRRKLLARFRAHWKELPKSFQP